MNYPEDFVNKIIQGDCLEVMKELPDNSIDCIVTDPPYQLSSMTRRRTDRIAVEGNDGNGNPYCRPQAKSGFMGKEWDVLPPVEVWQECLRVLKPGAFAFIMTTPRQDSLCQILMDLSKAGFQMGFTSIYWTYASGFPKAENIGKMVDKKLGVDVKEGKGFKIAGEYGNRNLKDPTPQGEERDKIRHKPQSYEAKDLDGSYGGFQPKPAVEIILVVSKPLSEKTYVDQALKNKKGITWLGDCRIPYKDENDIIPQLRDDKREVNAGKMYRGNSLNESKTKATIGGSKDGRFPANLLVSNDSLNDGKISKSGQNNIRRKEGMFVEHKLGGKNIKQISHNDSGSYSRYFDLDKWFVEKLKELPKSMQKTFPFLIVPKASKAEKNKGLKDSPELSLKATPKGLCESSGVHYEKTKGNVHPTCKPIKLMSYLITLGSREGDVILDPFVGSGTTCIAAKMLSRKFIGVEKEEEYVEIAEARLKSVPTFIPLF